jgi:(S)-ureidoglycine aminohydrolase
MNHLGQTRSRVTSSYAFIAPDGHVTTGLPGWKNAQGIILVSPQLGARFTQYLAIMEPAGESGPSLPGVERFVYVLEGEIALTLESGSTALERGGFAYLPANAPHSFVAEKQSRLNVYERRYLSLHGVSPPGVVTGNAADAIGEPFLGDPDLIVKKLLPDETAFDIAVNTMTFTPGTTLPFAETHFMEHGMLMLSGGGVYRLGDDWHPIQEGDVLWMGPYLPQWFGALGKHPASYLLYKEANRDPFAFEKES